MARAKDPAVDARFKVRIMEGVFERAVEQAAKTMNQQLRTVSPDLVLLTGAARARGYRLDGYGLFFDVQVPAALRQSMGWTVRMMRQNSANTEQALATFRRMVETMQGRAREDAELALRQIELQVRPPQLGMNPSQPAVGLSLGPAAGFPSGTAASTTSAVIVPVAPENVQASSTPVPAEAVPAAPSVPVGAAPEVSATRTEPETAPAPPPPSINPLLIQNPDLAYEIEVREALIAAMLEWGVTLPLQPAEWLTVAARDNEDVVIPGEAADVVTIIMRVKGSDLTEFRAGRLTAADLRRRVEVREF
jgi:hypothetical protein